MAKRTLTPNGTALACLVVAYHVACLVKDGESVQANWINYQRNRTGANLLRLLLAEGVFIRDLGLAA